MFCYSRRRYLATTLLMSCCFAPGCVPGAAGPADTFGLDLRMPSGAKTDGAVVFFLDGVNADRFEKMLDAGELPAIKHYFADRGLYVRRGVSGVPSVTLPNMTAMVTGCLPGRSGVTGVNWFDRDSLIWRNYATIAHKNTLDGDYLAATLYEQFSDRTTASVFFQPHRGATKFFENWTSAGPPFFFGWYEFVDRLTLSRLNSLAEIARKSDGWPALTVVYMLAPDFRGYDQGEASPEYRAALLHADRQIGRVLGDMARAGLLKTVHIALVADHGMLPVERHFPLERFLGEQAGLRVASERLNEKTPFEKRQDIYEPSNCVFTSCGERYAAIYFRKPLRDTQGRVSCQPWIVRPDAADLASYPVSDKQTVNLPELLASREEVDAVAWATGDGCARLKMKAGEVEFAQSGGIGGAITYRVISGDDPLGWKGKVSQELLAGSPASPREWLNATNATDFPDLPMQLLTYFRARRAGDLVAFAAPGWDFGQRRKGGHGGIRAGEMHLPILLAGPGVPHEKRDTARQVDLMPTLLKLMNRPVPTNIDGQSLIP